jgi:hypothetical protein
VEEDVSHVLNTWEHRLTSRLTSASSASSGGAWRVVLRPRRCGASSRTWRRCTRILSVSLDMRWRPSANAPWA